MKTAIVIGGGIVGLTAALALAQEGFRVDVLERDSQRTAASWGNAGHLATEQVEPLASPGALAGFMRRLFVLGGPLAMPPRELGVWLPFARRFIAASTPARHRAGTQALRGILAAALPEWMALAAELSKDPQGADMLRTEGHYVTWQDAGAAKKGIGRWRVADTGTTSAAPADKADLARLADLAPETQAALRFTGSGSVTDLDALRGALEARLIARGGRVLIEEATLANVAGQARVNGRPADLVVLAGGVGSGALMKAMGYTVPIIAERGYHIRAAAPRWPQDMPPVVFEQRNLIVTRYRDCVQAASFVEFARVDAPPDPRKWARLERHVKALGLPVEGPFRRWMGARPTLPDYLPAIGRSRRAGNLIYAFGHQHLGLTLSAVNAKLVVDLATGRTPALDLSPFDIERFS